MKNSALGLIETYGYVGAVEAADAALKAADVSLVNLVKVKGGIVTLTLEGGVSEVKASVDAGAASAQRLGTLITSHVIPRLDEEVWSIVEPNIEKPHHDPDPYNDETKDQEEEEEEENKKDQKLEGKTQEIIKEAPVESEPFSPLEVEEENEATRLETNLPKKEHFTREMLDKIKVVELRTIARTIDNLNMEKNQIKYANKATLIKEISEAQERSSET